MFFQRENASPRDGDRVPYKTSSLDSCSIALTPNRGKMVPARLSRHPLRLRLQSPRGGDYIPPDGDHDIAEAQRQPRDGRPL